MKLTKPRIVSLVLAVCMIISMFSMLTVSAAAPTSLDIAGVAKISDSAAKAIKSGIEQGKLDVDGVYFDVAYPTTLVFTEGSMSTEAYILMAANALYALAQGKAATTAIAHKEVKAIEGNPVVNGTGNSCQSRQNLQNVGKDLHNNTSVCIFGFCYQYNQCWVKMQ